MIGTRISSGSKFEEIASYSRVAIVPDPGGDWLFVSGTTGFDYATMTIKDDVEEQTHQIFRNMAAALEKAGSSLDDVVRIRAFLVRAEDFPKAAAVVGQYMKGAMPANTTVVAGMIDPRILIEIEVMARKPAAA